MPPWEIHAGRNIAQYGNDPNLLVHRAVPRNTDMENPVVKISFQFAKDETFGSGELLLIINFTP